MKIDIYLAQSAGYILAHGELSLSKACERVYGPLVPYGHAEVSPCSAHGYWRKAEWDAIAALLQRQNHVLIGMDEAEQLFGKNVTAVECSA